MKEQSNQFLYVFRGGTDPAEMSPEQMCLLFNLLLLRRGAVFYLERGSQQHPIGDTAKSNGRAMAAIR